MIKCTLWSIWNVEHVLIEFSYNMDEILKTSQPQPYRTLSK